MTGHGHADGADVLLVATLSGAVPHVFPMGVVDLMNRVTAPKLGLFAREVTPGHVRRARVIALPLHWFYSIGPVLDLARRFKAVNPRAAVVVGGYTATAFDDALIAKGPIDYIVRGDAEGPFPALVGCLLDGRPVDAVPNLTFRGGKTPLSYAVTPAEFARGNYRDVSWFPSFARLAARLQRVDEVSFLHPWVPVMRGCALDCDGCFAATEVQQALAGRGPIARPAHAVQADLHYWSGRRDIRHCHFNADFISVLGMRHAREVLDGSRFDLDCYYEWYRLPAPEALDLLRASFGRLTLAFFFNMREACVNAGDPAPHAHEAALAGVLRRVCADRAVTAIVYADPAIAARRPDYARACARIARLPRVRLFRYDSEVIPPVRGLDRAALAALYPGFVDRAAREVPALRARGAFLGAVQRAAPAAMPVLARAGSFSFAAQMLRYALR